jgi:hypothetical protein
VPRSIRQVEAGLISAPFQPGRVDSLASRFLQEALEVWPVEVEEVPFENFIRVLTEAMRQVAAEREELHKQEIDLAARTQALQIDLGQTAMYRAGVELDALGGRIDEAEDAA